MSEWLCWRRVVRKTGRIESTRNRKLSRWRRPSRRISRWRRSRPTSRRSAQQIWLKLHSYPSEGLPPSSQNILFYYFTTRSVISVKSTTYYSLVCLQHMSLDPQVGSTENTRQPDHQNLRIGRRVKEQMCISIKICLICIFLTKTKVKKKYCYFETTFLSPWQLVSMF